MGDKGKQTKELIMRAAVALFSEKGFDAAGVRELADRAGVPKSLLYYHFKNKESILHELISDVFLEMDRVLNDILKNSVPGKWNAAETALALEKLFTEKRDAVRIVFTVALRSSEMREVILQNLANFQSKKITDLEAHGIQIKNRNKMLMERFFFGFGPFFTFLFFKEEWRRLTGLSEESTDRMFRSLMADQVELHAQRGWGDETSD